MNQGKRENIENYINNQIESSLMMYEKSLDNLKFLSDYSIPNKRGALIRGCGKQQRREFKLYVLIYIKKIIESEYEIELNQRMLQKISKDLFKNGLMTSYFKDTTTDYITKEKNNDKTKELYEKFKNENEFIFLKCKSKLEKFNRLQKKVLKDFKK